jgi:hypothetical protein
MLFRIIEWSQYTGRFALNIGNERGCTKGLFLTKKCLKTSSQILTSRNRSFNMALISLDYSDFGV